MQEYVTYCSQVPAALAQKHQETQASIDPIQFLSQDFRQHQEALYSQLSSKPIQSSRLLNLVSLIPEDFSLDVVNKLAHNIRPSSETTYDRHFNCFKAYVDSKVGTGVCFPLSLVVEFFNSLANKNFRSSTLKSIRSVLREPLKAYFNDYDIVSDPWINKIIQFVKRRNPRTSYNFPKWDLDIVMRMLTSRPETDRDFLFKKTLFISFLACPYRIAEFQAISISMSSFSPHHILLETHPSFSVKIKQITLLLLQSLFQSFQSLLVFVQ